MGKRHGGGGICFAVVLATAGCGGDRADTPDLLAPDAGEPIHGAVGGLDTGFRPNPNGFKFENYGNEGSITNLTAVEMRRLFGDAACASTAGGGCILTPPVQQWMEQENKGMNVGHCEGMAALSVLFFTRFANPADFGAASTWELAIGGNGKLQREIAYWTATQSTSPTEQSVIRQGKSPKDILDTLGSALKAGAGGESYILGIFKKGMREGHAITPYQIVDKGGGVSSILVYDNNYPGVERSLEIDANANVWRYTASTNPQVKDDSYAGDATSYTLGLTPSSARTKQQECGFCADFTPQQPPKGRRQILLEGGGDLLAADETGHRIGYLDGELINEIEGARTIGWTSDDRWQGHHEPTFDLPSGTDLTVSLDGSGLAGMSPSDVSLIGAGYTLAVEGVQLDPGQKDTITFSKMGNELSYRTEGRETPTIVIGIEAAGPDFEFAIQAEGDAYGQQIDLQLDHARGRLRITTRNSAGTTSYDIEVHRIDDAGEQVFVHHGNSERSGDTVYLDYAAWKGHGSPMTVELDTNSDGTIDSTATLANGD